MTLASMIAATPHRNVRPSAGLIIGSVAMAMLLLAPCALAAGSGSKPAGASHVKLESIPGSAVKRVILTAKAAERLGIQTDVLGEERIVRKQIVGGQVVPAFRIQMVEKMARGPFGGFGQASAEPALQPVAAERPAPASGDAWIGLALSQEEWDRIAKDKPARVLALATRDKLPDAVVARPSKLPPLVDAKRSMLTVYYVVSGGNHGLKVNDRMRLELPIKGNDEMRGTVPYSALYYDDKGIPWVYINTRPLTYERRRVEVDRIEGERAILKSGPGAGARVVSVGAPLLYGAEVIFKY